MSNYWAFPYTPPALHLGPYDDDDDTNTDTDDADTDDDSDTSSSQSTFHQFADYLIRDTQDDPEDPRYATVDAIYYADQEYLDAPKTHGATYLGCVCGDLLLELVVSPQVFYHYPPQLIREYLRRYTIRTYSLYRTPRLDIFRLHIDPQDGTYRAILKTHWLRLIQRHWKKAYQERTQVHHQRCKWANQRYFQYHGRYLPGTNHLPSLHGLLAVYTNPKTHPHPTPNPRSSEI